MFFAGLPPERTAGWSRTRLSPSSADEIEISVEPEGEARFQWLLARKPE